MPTEKPRFSITLDEALADKIDNYKFTHRMKNQTQAVVSLIEKGFESLHSEHYKTEKSPAPEDAEDLISMEESNRLFDSLVQAGLIQDNIEFSTDDRAFLSHVIGLLEVWVRNKRA